MTIDKSTIGNVFVGYTDPNFRESTEKDGNKNSFPFAQLVNKIVKCKCLDSEIEILDESRQPSLYSYLKILVSFGKYYLCIFADCNEVSKNFAWLNDSFEKLELPTYYLAG